MTEPFTTLRSRTIVLPTANIDTDQIIPARFLTTTSREGLGQHAFIDWRRDPGCALNDPRAAGCEVLVAGDNFGCGSSREHAPWALVDMGIRAVISTGIADIFAANAVKNGLLPVLVDPETHDWLLGNPWTEVSVDLQTCTLHLPEDRSVSFPMDGFARKCLLEGFDELGYLLDNIEAIDAFERTHP